MAHQFIFIESVTSFPFLFRIADILGMAFGMCFWRETFFFVVCLMDVKQPREKYEY